MRPVQEVMGTAGLGYRPHGVPTQTSRRLVWGVLAIVALSPLPLASNRPFFWAIWATLAGCLCFAFLWSLRRNRRAAMPMFAGAKPVLLLVVAYLAFLVAEMVPVARYLPPDALPELPLGLQAPALSLHWGETWYALLRSLTYLCLFFVAAQVIGKLQLQRSFLNTLLFIITAYALYSLVALTQLGDTILFFEKWTYQGSATGTFVNRNSFATFLAFGAIIGTTMTISGYEERAKRSAFGSSLARRLIHVPWITAVCTITITAAALATQSRMGAAVAIGGAFLAATLALCRRWGSAGVLGPLMIGIAAIVALLWLYGGGLGERFGSLEHSTGVRLALYAQVAEMIETRPLLGFGGGTFPLVFPLFHQPSVNVDLVWDRAHSTYLSLWSDHGLIVGSIPMIAGGMLIMRCAQRLLTQRGMDWEAPLIALVASCAAALHSLVDFSLEIQANAIMLTALLAAGLSCRLTANGSGTSRAETRRGNGMAHEVR